MTTLTPSVGATTTMLAGYGLLTLFLVATWSEADARRLSRPDARLVLIGIGLGMALFLVGGAAYALSSTMGLETGPPESASASAIGLLPGVMLAAVSEELVFRGRVQSSLAAHMPAGAAVLLQAALFALYHLTLGQLLATFAHGLILGLATRRGGVTLALLAHVVLNVLGFGVLVLSSGS